MHLAPQGLVCKICERGTLIPKKIFRLSGPAVAIGYILLIPSVLGMIFCALMLAGVFAVSGQPDQVSDLADRPAQSAFDADFRRDCMNGAKLQAPDAGLPSLEEICECMLSTYKQTHNLRTLTNSGGTITTSGGYCSQQFNEGRLAPVSPDVAALYTGENPQSSPDAAMTTIRTPDPLAAYKTTVIRALGGGFTLAMGIGFFVSGLLGWLLVMKKRVLKCDYCGAVVNAS